MVVFPTPGTPENNTVNPPGNIKFRCPIITNEHETSK